MSLSGNLCRKYYLLIAYANRSALIQHSTILSRTFQIHYSQKRWSGSCLNKRTKKKTQQNPNTEKLCRGRVSKQLLWIQTPGCKQIMSLDQSLICLARGLVLCQVQNQEESCLWSHFSCTGPTESSYSVLAVIYTWLGHQCVSWSISNCQGLLH